MNIGILILLTVFIGGMLFIIQRSESKRRLIVALIMLLPAELIRRYVFYREIHPQMLVVLFPGDLLRRSVFSRNLYTEAWVALIVALVVNLFFWLLIGRYNPVRKSDEEIRVIGMDD
ncbi:MAG: hypothetical protein ABI835_13490 [Chloroflexota bacterium]